MLWRCALVALVYLSLALPKINQPISDDEIYEVRNAERILAGERVHLYVPPLYDCLLAGVMATAGTEPWVLRLVGVASALLALAACGALAAEVAPAGRNVAALVASLALAVNPAFVQGSLLIHIDNTILVPAVLVWIYLLARFARTRDNRDLFLSALALSGALLAKFSTPTLIAPAALLFFGANTDARGLLVRVASSVVLGYALFAVWWAAMATAMELSFLEPFAFAAARLGAQAASEASWWQGVVRNLWTLVAWITPFLLCSLIVAARTAVREVRSQRIPLVGLASGAVLAYLFLSAINHGFPKYFAPGVPLFAVVLAVEAVRGRDSYRSLLLLGVGSAAWYLAWGFEPVYFLRWTIREALVAGHGLAEMLPGAVLQGAVWAVPAAVWAGWKLAPSRWGRGVAPPALAAGLLVLTAAQGATTCLVQAAVRYQTNYSYGEVGSGDLDAHLRAKLAPADRVLATQDVLYRLGRRHEFIDDETWTDVHAFFELLQRPATRFLVYSLPSQSVTGFRTVFGSARVRRYLHSEFDEMTLGTFTVFERKARSAS